MKRGLLLIDRGSRENEVKNELELICQRVKEKGNYEFSNYCFLEVIPPFIEEGIKKSLTSEIDSLTIVPYFLYPGKKVKAAVNEAIKFQAKTDVKFVVSKPMTMHKTMINLVNNRVTSALETNAVKIAKKNVDVLIIGHGSKDPNAQLSIKYVVDGWNICRWSNGVVEQITEMEAEFGRPQWTIASSTYGFQSDHRIICSYVEDGNWRLASLDTELRQLNPIPTPYSDMARGDLRVASDTAVIIAGSPVEALSVVRLDLATGDTQMLRTSGDVSLGRAYLSTPEAIEYPTENGLTAHAFYYPPSNPDYEPIPGEKPPLLVKSHGGPTNATSVSLDLGIHRLRPTCWISPSK